MKTVKTMTKILAGLALMALTPTVHAEEICSAPLIAGGGGGGGEVVGDVVVESDGEFLYVDYQVAGDWCISDAHLHVGATVEDLPMTKKGNPKPGKFFYSDGGECGDGFDFVIPIENVPEGAFVLGAHGVVSTVVGYDSNLEDFAAGLPDQVSMLVKHAGTAYGEPSYFDLFVSGGSVLDGIYDDYCIDTDRTIQPGQTYTANVYSSYETLPEGMLEQPENLDLLNYILNQGYAGTASADGSLFTFGDIQRAIWTLIDDQVSAAGLGSWSQTRVNEIIDDAAVNGEGFVPECGDFVGVIFQPVDNAQITIAQVTMAAIAAACDPIYRSETAWAEGADFPGDSWAMYMSCSF